MKSILTLISMLLLLATTSFAQPAKSISREEYLEAFMLAVSKTNADYPVIFTVDTTRFENGKVVGRETVVNENEAAGRSRSKTTIVAAGVERFRYQITAGFGNVFCSDDGTKWSPSKFECGGRRMISMPRQPERVEYTSAETTIDGKQVRILREFSVFVSASEAEGKTYSEKISSLDQFGLFIRVVTTEGRLEPKTITRVQEQTWKTKFSFDPVKAPALTTENR